jgi:hypothetical protein
LTPNSATTGAVRPLADWLQKYTKWSKSMVELGVAAVPVVYLGGAGGLRLGALAFARRGCVTLHRVVVEIVQQVVGPLQHGGVQLFRFGRPAVQILVIAHQRHAGVS